MKVLHITNNYPTTNHPIFGIFVKEQIDSLSEIGLNNTVFFINTREKGLKEYFFSYFRMIGHLITHKYDIIHCHHSFSAAILIFTLFPLFNKCIVSFQNDPSKELNGYLFPLCNLLFRKIILKNKSKKYISYKKCIYFPNGVNTNFFKSIPIEICEKITNLDSHKKYILFLDSYNRRTQKRIDRFYQVIHILKNKYRLDEIEPLVLTNTERNLVPFYMNNSSLHLITSDFEGSPNSVKECLSCNIPVVSTPVGNVEDLMGDIEGCYISNTFEPEELAELCMQSFKNKSFNGREKFLCKKMDTNNVAIGLLNIYNQL